MLVNPPDIEQAAARFWADPATHRAREALARPDPATQALIERVKHPDASTRAMIETLRNPDELTRRLMEGDAPGAPAPLDPATRAQIESAARTVRALAPAAAAVARQHPALRAMAPAVAAFAGRPQTRFNR